MKSRSDTARGVVARRTRRLAVLAVLSAIGLIIWAVRQRHGISTATGSPLSAQTTGDNEQASVAEFSPLAVNGSLELARDPFAWTSASVGKDADAVPIHDVIRQDAMKSLRIDAIVYRGESSLVSINDEIYRRGDTVAGFHIRGIEKRHVVVEKNGVLVEISVRTRDQMH